METAAIQQELGRFIVLFQAMDDAVNEIKIRRRLSCEKWF